MKTPPPPAPQNFSACPLFSPFRKFWVWCSLAALIAKFAIVLVIQFEPTSQISKFMTTLEIFQVGFFFPPPPLQICSLKLLEFFFRNFYQFLFLFTLFKKIPFVLVTTMQNSPEKNPTHILGIYLCLHDSELHKLF